MVVLEHFLVSVFPELTQFVLDVDEETCRLHKDGLLSTVLNVLELSVLVVLVVNPHCSFQVVNDPSRKGVVLRSLEPNRVLSYEESPLIIPKSPKPINNI